MHVIVAVDAIYCNLCRYFDTKHKHVLIINNRFVGKKLMDATLFSYASHGT